MKCLIFLLLTLGIAMSFVPRLRAPTRDPQERDPVKDPEFPDPVRDPRERTPSVVPPIQSDPQERDHVEKDKQMAQGKSISLLQVAVFIQNVTLCYLLLRLVASCVG